MRRDRSFNACIFFLIILEREEKRKISRSNRQSVEFLSRSSRHGETSLDARRTWTKGEVVSFIGGGKREIKRKGKKKEEARRSGSIGGGGCHEARRVLFGEGRDEHDGGGRVIGGKGGFALF